MEKINYLSVVKAMERLVQRILSLEVKREDPYGKTSVHKVSDVRIAYMVTEEHTISYMNGIQGLEKENQADPEMLFTFFVSNNRKVVNLSFPLGFVLLSDPDGICSIAWPILAEAVDQLFDEFYASKSKDNKFYQEDKSVPVVMEYSAFSLLQRGKIPQSSQDLFLSYVRSYYLNDSVLTSLGSLTSKRKIWIVVDGSGTRVIQEQFTAQYGLTLVLPDDEKRLYSQHFSSIYRDWESFESDFPIVIEEKSSEFFSSKNRKQLESGIYPLILDYAAVGTLFHEALAGHMLSGAYILTGESTIFKGKLGKQIAENGFMEVLNQIQIWDCPLDSSMIASYQYDMEGTPAQDVLLIDHGKLNGYLLGKNSSSYLKLPNNGHALAGNFISQLDFDGINLLTEAKVPEPRVSNLKIFSDSAIGLDEIRKGYLEKFGYYIQVSSSAGNVDVETGTFNLIADYLVKVFADGRKEYFHGGTFSANFADFLSAIRTVSNDYGKNQGLCGSGSGWVPTEELVPAMSIYGVNWAPSSLPEKSEVLDLKQDKYIPDNWR